MNFLAHLHLATLADSSLLGNLMADYIRGNPYQQWPAAVADGIILHRRVDAMTDTLPAVREARQLFRTETRRVAPVTLDVVWDHFLAKNWTEYYPAADLATFCQQVRQVLLPDLPFTPAGFQQLNHYLWQERWLEHYADAGRLEAVLNGMAARRPRLSALRDSYQDFRLNYRQLETIFQRFYPDMMLRASRHAF